MCHLGDSLVVQDIVLRIGQRLDVDRTRLGTNRPLDVLRIRSVDERHVDAQPAEGLAEQRNRAAVKRLGADDVLPTVSEVQQRHGDRLLAAGYRQAADAAFQSGHPLLENVRRRVHQSRVDPAHFLQREQIGGMLGVSEAVTGRLMDGHGAASQCWGPDAVQHARRGCLAR